MNELTEKFAAARFGKEAEDGAAAPPRMELTPELRAIRRSIERSMRRMEQQQQTAQEALSYARQLTAAPAGLPWYVSSAIPAGLGAGAAYAGSRAMAGTPWGLEHTLATLSPKKIQTALTGAGIPEAEAISQAGKRHIANILGTGGWRASAAKAPLIGRLFKPLEAGKLPAAARGLRTAIQADPTLRGQLVKAVRAAGGKGSLLKLLGGGTLAGVGLLKVLPWIMKHIRYAGVGGPEAIESKQEAMRALQRSEGYRRFIEAQLAQLEKARATGGEAARIPIEPFAKRVPYIAPPTLP